MSALRLLLFLSLPALAGPLAPEHAARIDSEIRALLAQHPSAGLSVGVRHGEAEWTGAYGYAQLSPPRPATPRTSYRLASVTKTLTAVAIMQLAEAGKLDLDAELHTYLPKFPKKQWPITVRELLSHLSGIHHYRDQKKEGHFKTHFTTAQALHVFDGWPLAHEPGTKFLYTSYGYNVLGAIVEAVSGQSYGEYLKEHIFAPAGMTHSGLEDRAKRDGTWARGYKVKGGQLQPSEEIDISSRFAGGGTRSTVEDLLHYSAALTGGALVKPETWAQMQTPARTRDGQLVDYGLGFAVYPQHGHLVVAHMGSQPETSTLLLLVPKAQLTIALASNVENQSELLSEIAAAVIETLLEDGLKRRPLYADDPADQVLLDGMTRVYSYGLARREGWGGTLPEADDAAFAELFTALSRDHAAADPEGTRKALQALHQPSSQAALPRVGAAMAALLEAEHPGRNYAALGPILFFADYAEACARRACSTQLPPKLREDLGWMTAQWSFAGAKLAAWRLDRAADARELAEVLEPMLLKVSVHPDFVPELSALSERWRLAGREADALAVLELSARLHPSSQEAQLELADWALLHGDEARATELYASTPHELLAKRVPRLELSTHPRANSAAQWLRHYSSEAPR